MYAAGMASSHWPSPPNAWWVASALEIRFAGVSIAPFGLPVDPEVETTRAMSSSIGAPGSNVLRSRFVRAGSFVGTGKSARWPVNASSSAGMIASGFAGSTGRSSSRLVTAYERSRWDSARREGRDV